MSLLHYPTKPDRRAGFVLVAVFVLGMLGASLATVMNGGALPRSAAATVHLAKMTTPM